MTLTTALITAQNDVPFKNDLHSWWDLSDISTIGLTGSNIDSISNKGNSAISISYNSGVRITHSSDSASCNGSQNDYRAGAAGDYDFIHDGTGATVFVIHNQDAGATGLGFLLNSRLDSAEGYDLRTDMSGNQRYRTTLENSTNNNYTANSDNNNLNVGLPVIFSSRLGASDSDNVTMYEDGIDIFNAVDTGYTYGTGSHALPMRPVVSYTGNLHGILIFDRKLSTTEHQRVLKWLRDYYNLERQADVYLLIGASNAEGLGSSAFLSATYQGIIEKSYILAHKDGDATTNPSLDIWPHEQANSHVDQTSSDAGIDLSLMYTKTQSSSRKSFLIKSTVSGSDLFAQWNKDDQPALAAAWDELALRLGQFAVLLEKRGYQPCYKACIIGLGENDATASFRYNDYQDNQEKLNARLRGITTANLPIVLINCSTEDATDTSARSDSQMAGQSTVRTAQATVASAESNTSTYQPITAGSAPDHSIAYNETTPNGIHFDMATLEQIGIDIAALV